LFVDNDFPKLLGAELYRPHPAYVVEMAAEPVVVHDFSKQPGQTVQLDRYRFWGNPGSKESRERTAEQTIGTANSRNIVKDKVLVTLREYTGPADPSDPTQPSTFKIARETLITAQRLLLDTGNLTAFHQSIGSLTLLDDYRRWRDRVFINELLKAVSKGQASDSQGGYYYPGDLAVGSLTYANAEQAKFDVKDDLLRVVKSLRKRNTPTYQDGFYRCVCDPTFLMHLRQNSDFREVARYPGNGQINPLMSSMQPNAAIYMGQGFGQATFVAGEPIIGMFFGPQSVGVGIGGNNAQVLLNNNDDFSRFIMMIWSLYAGFELLNADFATIAYSFNA
jgi:hypothetical protein